MVIHINDKRKVFAVQEEFSKVFPYLKLEFLAKPSSRGGAHPKKFVTHAAKTIGECRTVHNEGDLHIDGNLMVTELENRFHDVFGLGVQIFRRAGNIWLEATVTGNWTLDEQNRQGESLTNYITKNFRPENNQSGG
jgi:hypothetical protein